MWCLMPSARPGPTSRCTGLIFLPTRPNPKKPMSLGSAWERVSLAVRLLAAGRSSVAFADEKLTGNGAARNLRSGERGVP